jgi:phospholipid transport system substrate-binding protein
MEVVKSGQHHVQAAVDSRGGGSAALEAGADALLDFVELSRRVLGPKQWSALSAQQQQELATSLKGLLRASYLSRLMKDGAGMPSQVKWGDEHIEGNEARVMSTVEALNDHFAVEYRLFRADEGQPWRVYDVVTEDASLVDVYRDQFRKVIAEKGYAGLLETLKARRAKLERERAKS